MRWFVALLILVVVLVAFYFLYVWVTGMSTPPSDLQNLESVSESTSTFQGPSGPPSDIVGPDGPPPNG